MRAEVLAARTYPGIQLVETTYSARVSVRAPEVDQAAVDALFRRLLTQALTGVIGSTEAEITEAVVADIARSPETYLTPTGRLLRERRSISAIGTGWLVTPDGYVVTAAHVVSADRAELAPEFAGKTLDRLVQQFVRGLAASGTPLRPDQVDRLSSAVGGWLAVNMSVDDLRTSVALQVARGVDGQGRRQDPVPATVVDVGTPYPGNDVALLKVDTEDDFPTLPLGEDDDVTDGSTLYVAGYPAASTFSPGLSSDAQVQSTITQGPLTARKTTDDGMPVFQTQAPASPGNSGGPVLDDRSEVVGILVASAVGDDGVALEGQEFVLPISVVAQMLDANGVDPEAGETTRTYDEALDAFYAQRYREALPLLEETQDLYPGHPYVAGLIGDANAAIAAGEDRTPAPSAAEDGAGISTTTWLVAALGALAVVALSLLVVLLLVVRRSRRTARAPSGAAAYGGPPPGPPPPGAPPPGPPPGWSPPGPRLPPGR